jgi:drug/metabolite transporter (DMT)-like permease
LVAGITGELLKLGQFSWQAYVFFALSGIIHFALGRNCGNRAVQLIGATRSGTVVGLNAIFSIVLAVIILNETVTLLMVLGILFALSGPLLIAAKEPAVTSNPRSAALPHITELDRRTLYKGMLYAIGAAIFWGSSAIFIKLGLESGGSALGGSFIAYSAASIVISPSILLDRELRKEMVTAEGRSLRLALLSGLTTNVAQMLRYLALGFSTVIVISIVGRTIPAWVLLFAFIFNRKLESFSHWVLLGNALLITGTALVIFS